MKLALTSNLPSAGNDHLFAWMRTVVARPRIAWIPPYTDPDRARFTQAQARFASHGFDTVEYCDIDEQINRVQLSQLAEYDVIYLSGGDPVRFRHNLLRAGLADRLRECLTAGRLIVGASGGSMQLTQNVSLFRLVNATIDEVLADHAEYAAMGLVPYEILPHVDRWEPPFLEQVRRYSERVEHDIIGLADGSAMLHTSQRDYQCIGQVQRFRKGVVSTIGAKGDNIDKVLSMLNP
ncbi:MAG: Type 1 glutamine amidotransferase-like domain-containing protein [Caldilineaceae bacterium]